MRAFQQKAGQALGEPPGGCDTLPALDGLVVLDKAVLIDFSGRQMWPPSSSSFAADFAQAMTIPSAGPAWSDPQIRERQRAEREAERQRLADYHEQAHREQTERQNRELAENFARSQRRAGSKRFART